MSDSGTAWAVVAAALGSSLLTVGGTFGLDALRSKRRRHESEQQTLTEACNRLVGGAMRLAYRSGSLHEAMISRSGFTESLDIVMHQRKPFDILETGDWLLTDLAPMLDAQTTIWLLGDETLISKATEVILVGQEVVSKSTALAESQKAQQKSPVSRFKQLTKDPDIERERDEAVTRLGNTLRSFAHLMRSRLGTPDLDALLRAFPGPTEQETIGLTT